MIERANRIVENAWRALLSAHRALLENIDAAQWQVTSRPLGGVATELLTSAGSSSLPEQQRRSLDASLGAWVPELRVTLINAGHPKFKGLDQPSFAAAITDVAWHEWGHALSLHRAEDEDVARGPELLDLAPTGIAENIRSGGYRRRQITHELVANLFATLMARHQAGGHGKPEWLEEELWNLVKRTIN